MPFRHIKEIIKGEKLIEKLIKGLHNWPRYYGYLEVTRPVDPNSLDIKGKVKYYKDLLEKLEIQFNKQFRRYTQNKDESKEWFFKDNLKETSEYKEVVARKLDTYRKIKSGKMKEEEFNFTLLKQIKLDTITEILPNGFFRNNPFRNEHSPSNSLHWNKKNNRWTDYGSGKHGDAIDLYMIINQVDFLQACRELTQFI